MRIAVIGDSISSRNNGASADCWPRLFATMIEDGGVFGIEVRNYSIPGLRWKTAHVPTQGWLLGGGLTPLAAAALDGCDKVLLMLGVNDRQSDEAERDALGFLDALKISLPTAQVHMVRQVFTIDGQQSQAVVTPEEQALMNQTYSKLNWAGMDCNIGKLYSMGYHYDGLHPTNSGKQWIASAVYRYLEPILGLTPITRNIAWLWEQPQSVQMQLCNVGR